jgi:hypothetical protein
MARVFSPESFTVGVVLVAVGVLWTAANLGHVEFLRTLRTWWPMALVVWGGAELLAAIQSYRGRSAAGAAPSSPGEIVLPSQLDGDDRQA